MEIHISFILQDLPPERGGLLDERSSFSIFIHDAGKDHNAFDKSPNAAYAACSDCDNNIDRTYFFSLSNIQN